MRIVILFMVLVLSFGSAHAQLFSKSTAKSTSVVNIGSQSYYVHTVSKGETLSSLARLYNVAQSTIVQDNPQTIDGLQVGQVLKIQIVKEELSRREQKAMAKLFNKHVVNQGETAYSIAKRYGISVNTLIEDNQGVDIMVLSIGQQLNIRKSDVGDSSDTQIKNELEQYRDKLNSVSTDYKYHLVVKGETVYSLSKQFEVSQEAIIECNELKDGLKLGSMIKIPIKAPVVEPVTNTVEQEHIFRLNNRTNESSSIKAHTKNQKLNVAMLLPLKSGGTSNKSFVEFYQGALIALEQLKTTGISVELNLYNTGRSAEAVEEIVTGNDFANTDLIIGPVYEESIAPAVNFAHKNHVPIVSPLAIIENESSELIYQLSPQSDTKYDKMRELLSAQKNIVVISGIGNDTEFEQEITPILPYGYRRFAYSKGVTMADIENLINGEKDNVFIVLPSNEYNVEEILARISSVQNNLVARSIKNANITIVGGSRWNRFANIDKNLFFKLGLCFVTSYHADRSNERVADFDKRYIAAFNSLPTLYSYRGFDATKLFISAMVEPGANFTQRVNSANTQLLQMPYYFKQTNRKSNNVNNQWALVIYRPDYTITVK